MHNHDTNETFIPMTGFGAPAGEDERAMSGVDLGRSISVVSARHDPPFEGATQRRLTRRRLMFVIGLAAPARSLRRAVKRLETAGVWSPQ